MGAGVVAVIVNWNGSRSTIECLESLLREGRPDLGVVVVDNGSDDGSVDAIRRFCTDGHGGGLPFVEPSPGGRADPVDGHAIILLRSATNLGYTGGNNLGMRYAMEAMRPRYVLLLNNDVVVAPGFIETMLASAEAATGVGMWQPKVLMMRRPGTVSGIGIGIRPDGQTFMIGYGEPDDGRHDMPREVFAVYGCAVLCNVRMLEQVGLFEEGFFAYYEDVELSWRALLHGWRCMYVPTARVHHWEGASGAPFKGVLNLRNGVYCYLKHAPADLLVRMLLRAGFDVARFMVTSTGEERLTCLRLARRFGLFGKVPEMLRCRRALKVRRLESLSELRGMMEPVPGARQGLPATRQTSLTSAESAAARGVENAREDA